VDSDLQRLARLRSDYEDGLFRSCLPFWLRHSVDRQHGGLMTCLDRTGTLVDTDKAIWLQGRAAWTFATLYRKAEQNPAWLDVSRSCLSFIRRWGRSPSGKLYFTVTREGRPLRMRRYVYSESFAAMGSAALHAVTGEAELRREAIDYFATYLHHSFTPGVMPAKTDPETRPMQGLGPRMIAIATAQELRDALGEVEVAGLTFSAWIDRCIGEIAQFFYKRGEGALLELVGPAGEMIDHFDGRTLNPGHALECAWFVLREAKHRARDPRLMELGLGILDAMWSRGWDAECGGLFYFTDLRGLPVQEYWAQMKFWWPHNEAEIATLLAWQLTGDVKYAHWHAQVHEWSHRVFSDPEHGEWFGYAHRDGRISTTLKGNLWKGPFHLPRMQWTCARILAEVIEERSKS
jgi:N-acylglucosamine 2-epimerase